MKSLSVWCAIFVCLTVCLAGADASAAECPAKLPAGVIIRVTPDEKLTAGIVSGPTILTVTSDVRFFPNRPPLLSRGSKILGTIAESKQAGHFFGKARIRIALTSILTSDYCEYPISGRIIEAGKQIVKNDVVKGRGHATRDLIAFLFPPTTVYQVLRTPSRGPKLVLDNETPLTVKLLEPVSLVESSAGLSETDRRAFRSAVEQNEQVISNIKPAGLLQPTSRAQEQQAALVTSGPCSAANFNTARAVVQRNKVMRPVRNLTPYHVTVYLDRAPVLILAPCRGPSMIATPVTEFKLEGTASLPTAGGQKQIGVKVIPSAEGNGWDIVADGPVPVAFRPND